MINFKFFLLESKKKKHVHVFYGKLRYATIGHHHVVEQMREHAKHEKADTIVGLSNNPEPLGLAGKKHQAELVLRHPVETGEPHTRDFLTFVKELHNRGYQHVTIHAGSDRAQMYRDILERYNGKPTKSGEVLFNFKSINVVQAGGERHEGEIHKDPRNMSEEELIQTAKASRLIGYAEQGDEESKAMFKAYHKPLNLPSETVEGQWQNLKHAIAEKKQ